MDLHLQIIKYIKKSTDVDNDNIDITTYVNELQLGAFVASKSNNKKTKHRNQPHIHPSTSTTGTLYNLYSQFVVHSRKLNSEAQT